VAGARPKVVAPVSVDAELVTLHATNRGTGIDPKIGKQPALRKPPFNGYNSFKLIKRSGAILGKGMAWKTKLPNDHEVMISLKDVIMSKRKDDAPTFVIAASVAQVGATVFEPAGEARGKAGDTFFFPGKGYRGGILVVGVKLLEHADP
jgi:hypothetical protein